MSSLVTDVLNSAGALAREDIPTKVSKLKKKIEDAKLEVQEILRNRYIDFIPNYIKLDKVTGTLQSAENEFEMLHHHIEKEIKPEMQTSVTEYREMFHDLNKVSILKRGTMCLIDMHNSLETIRQTNQKNFVNAANNLLKFQEKLQEVNKECLEDVQIVSSLKTESIMLKIELIHYLVEFWNSKVVINYKPESQLQKIEMIFNMEQSDELSEVIFALNILNELNSVLVPFGKSFISLICNCIICNTTDMKCTTLNGQTVITISIIDKNHVADPVGVLYNLSELFMNINNALFCYPYSKDDTKFTLMSKLSNLIQNDFCNLVIKLCLKPAVPSRSSDLSDFQNLVDHAINLENLLRELHFFSTPENAMMQFIGNIDHLPANKMALDLLRRSRNLMKQDLHKTVEVGTEELPLVDTEKQEQTGELDVMANTKSILSKASFEFPSCHISESAKSLVELLLEVMDETKKLQATDSYYSMRLFCTARSICELYCSIVPTYHKNEINDIPQQTALHHNNCMYIAHCLLTLGQRHALRNNIPITFADVAQEIRRVGTEAFLAQMRTQRHHILQLLKDPEVFQNTNDEQQLVNKAEKAVRQCLQQLELLKRVWSGVLPIEVYFKAIATLLNTFLEEIITHIVLMEDIAAQTAAQFDSIFDIVLKQSPELFNVEKRGDKRDFIHKYVKRWFKFQELQLLLNANLTEIVDRWSSGKGPLATHFNVDEVKHLIRALFQNTERRAAALRKIR